MFLGSLKVVPTFSQPSAPTDTELNEFAVMENARRLNAIPIASASTFAHRITLGCKLAAGFFV
ncbi:MAG: hypothetical protein JWP80_1863 [Pseudomonas sp.]|nr:hypothetical protein [Pseudomonas sp.]